MDNSYLNDRLAIDRLKREYQEHRTLIIGFDFDNTIYDFHHNNLELEPVIKLLQQCSKLGFTMCLYTITPENHEESAKLIYCDGLGINVHFINESPILHNDQKPYFNILLDDRAGLSAAYNILKTTIEELKL